MAYTIKPSNPKDCKRISAALERAIGKDGRFLIQEPSVLPRRVELRGVRLLQAKPYCGNHAGPCVLGRPLRSYRYLEGEDWIAFNEIVNDVLDKLKVAALVWSTRVDLLDHIDMPRGMKRKLIIRHPMLGRRLHWDWEDKGDLHGRPHYAWNPGTEDQFKGL